MALVDDLLAASRRNPAPPAGDPSPRRQLAVVTCMDARIDVASVFGLALGEAHIIRNAGGRVTADVLRSLALSSGTLGVHTVVVMQHTRCGLEHVTDDELRTRTGADLAFLPIADHGASVREDVALLARTAFLSEIRTIAGLLYDVETGRVDELVRWERPAQSHRDKTGDVQ